MNKVDPLAKLATFDEPWLPKIIAELNGQQVKVAHFEGAYVWHSHAEEDELFYLLEGKVDLELRDRTRLADGLLNTCLQRLEEAGEVRPLPPSGFALAGHEVQLDEGQEVVEVPVAAGVFEEEPGHWGAKRQPVDMRHYA